MAALCAGNRIGFVSLASLNRLRYLLRNLKMSRPACYEFRSASSLVLGLAPVLFSTRVCQHLLDVQNEVRFLIAQNSALNGVLVILSSHKSLVFHFIGNKFVVVDHLHLK